MELTKENIKEWKIKLDIEILKQMDIIEYSETLNDEDWLDTHEGDTIQDVIDGEIDALRGCF